MMMRPIDFLYAEKEIVEGKLKETDSIKRSKIIEDQIEHRKFNVAGDAYLEEYKTKRDAHLQTQQTFVMVLNKKAEVQKSIEDELKLVDEAILHEKKHPITRQQETAASNEAVKKVNKGFKGWVVLLVIFVLGAVAYAYFTGQI